MQLQQDADSYNILAYSLDHSSSAARRPSDLDNAYLATWRCTCVQHGSTAARCDDLPTSTARTRRRGEWCGGQTFGTATRQTGVACIILWHGDLYVNDSAATSMRSSPTYRLLRHSGAASSTTTRWPQRSRLGRLGDDATASTTTRRPLRRLVGCNASGSAASMTTRWPQMPTTPRLLGRRARGVAQIAASTHDASVWTVRSGARGSSSPSLHRIVPRRAVCSDLDSSRRSDPALTGGQA